MTDWDAVAEEIGLPENWRERGYDAPEYMVSEDSVYRPWAFGEPARSDKLRCVWPDCTFTRSIDNVEAMFRHVHGKAHRHPRGCTCLGDGTCAVR